MDDDDLPDDDPDVVAGMERLRELRAVETGVIEFRGLPIEVRRCPECGTKLEVGGTEEHPYLLCPTCRVARIRN